MAASSSYSKLPAELLSRIAELVHEQDLALAASPVQRAIPARGENPGVQVDVSGGWWSSWYGRGIQALVQVDRRSRASAVPFLYEVRPLRAPEPLSLAQLTDFDSLSPSQSITDKQTSKLYFRLHVLGERLGDSVRHLAIGSDFAPYASFLACALAKLPNLSSLQLNWRALKDTFAEQGLALDEDTAALRSSLRSALGKVRSLEMEAVGDHSLLEVLECVDQAHLRKLHWVEPVWPSRSDIEVERAVSKLVGLVELEISCADRDELLEVQRRLRLPAVRSIVLGDTQMSYEESLAFAHDIAPSIHRLTIRVPTSRTRQTPNPLPSPLLPTLKSLIVEAYTYRPAFHQVDLPSLEHFKVALESDCDYFPLEVDEVPFRAAPLRTIALAFQGHPSLEPSEALVQACRAADVRLSVQHGPASVQQLQATVFQDVRAQALVEGKLDTVLDTLDWARRRAQWLHDVEDGPGLHELAEATVRLHERHVMDRA